MSDCYVVFHKQLGDLVLLEPTLDRLRAHHQGRVWVFTRGGHVPLMQLMGGGVMPGGFPFRPRQHLYCYDTVRKSIWRSLITPTMRKISILPDRNELGWFGHLLFRDIRAPGLGQQYVAEYFWENTPVPARGAFRPPRLDRPPEDWRPADLPSGPFILLNATSGWQRKSWRSEGWAEVVRALHDAGAPPVVMTSATSHWQVEHCRQIQSLADGFVHFAPSPTTLRHFLWLCANARMVLTVDGAAGHLSAAFGVPGLTLFGPTNLRNWHFPTENHIALQAPASRDGLIRTKNLTTPEVTAAALSLWANQPLSEPGAHVSLPGGRTSILDAP